jgi:hypothetical protein
MNKELNNYLINDLVNIVQDYLRPSVDDNKIKFNKVIKEINNINSNRHYFSFCTYYFYTMNIEKEKTCQYFFADRLLSGKLIIDYNPWPGDRSMRKIFTKYYKPKLKLSKIKISFDEFFREITRGM